VLLHNVGDTEKATQSSLTLVVNRPRFEAGASSMQVKIITTIISYSM